MPHFIRLRGPWNYQPLARWSQNPSGAWQLAADNLPNHGVMSLPGDWAGVLGQGYWGTVLFTRPFRCPAGLAAASRVWLSIEDVDWQATTKLNDRSLGEIVCSRAVEEVDGKRCPVRFDVTGLLQPQNGLAITVTSRLPADAERQCGRVGLVRLEIE